MTAGALGAVSLAATGTHLEVTPPVVRLRCLSHELPPNESFPFVDQNAVNFLE